MAEIGRFPFGYKRRSRFRSLEPLASKFDARTARTVRRVLERIRSSAGNKEEKLRSANLVRRIETMMDWAEIWNVGSRFAELLDAPNVPRAKLTRLQNRGEEIAARLLSGDDPAARTFATSTQNMRHIWVSLALARLAHPEWGRGLGFPNLDFGQGECYPLGWSWWVGIQEPAPRTEMDRSGGRYVRLTVTGGLDYARRVRTGFVLKHLSVSSQEVTPGQVIHVQTRYKGDPKALPIGKGIPKTLLNGNTRPRIWVQLTPEGCDVQPLLLEGDAYSARWRNMSGELRLSEKPSGFSLEIGAEGVKGTFCIGEIEFAIEGSGQR